MHMNNTWVSLIKMGQNNIHKNCVHYKDGLCTLNQIYVDPNGSACPRVIPKKLEEICKEAPSQSITQNNQQPFLNINYGKFYNRRSTRSGMGKKRRKRHGLSRARNRNY